MHPNASDLFGFLASLIIFIPVFFMMEKIVLEPMQQAVKVRAARVQSRLDEAERIATESRALEAKYRNQFAQLSAESEEMRHATRREVDRFRQRTAAQAEGDAAHAVEKARREAEKYRSEVLGELQHRTTALALTKVEGMLKGAFDADAQKEMAEQFIGKVAQMRAS